MRYDEDEFSTERRVSMIALYGWLVDAAGFRRTPLTRVSILRHIVLSKKLETQTLALLASVSKSPVGVVTLALH